MSRIADAKRHFGDEIEQELDALKQDVADLIRRARDAADDAIGLNKLAQSFNGLASTLDHASTQVDDTRTEVRKWLATHKEPIHEHVSPTALAAVKEARA